MHQQYDHMQTGAAVTKARRGRKPRAEPIANIRNDRMQTRALSATVIQQQNNNAFANHYPTTQDRSRNQILYQYSMPCTTSTSELSTVPSVTYSRKTVQTVPTSSYYIQKPPVLHNQHAQQMVTAPVEYALPKQVKTTQTNLTLTDIEIEMIKLLRAKEITELSQLEIILAEIDRGKKNSEDNVETEKTPIGDESCNEIIAYSDRNKSNILNFFNNIAKMKEHSDTIKNQQKAILEQQKIQVKKNQLILNQMVANQSLQQSFLDGSAVKPYVAQCSPITRQETTSPDTEIINSRTPNQQQVPDALQNNNYPISTLINVHNNGRNRSSAPPQQVQNFPPHLMQAAPPFGLNITQYGIPQYFQNQPPFQNQWWPRST